MAFNHEVSSTQLQDNMRNVVTNLDNTLTQLDSTQTSNTQLQQKVSRNTEAPEKYNIIIYTSSEQLINRSFFRY